MKERTRYVNHKGRSVDLNSSGIYVSSGELSNWSIAYSSTNGRSLSFRREQNVIPIALIVVGRSEAAGMAKRNELYDASAIDVDFEKPGRLYIGEWYMPGYIVESKKDRYWYTGTAADYELSFLPVDQRWTMEHDYSFRATSGGDGLNYPHGYPYDYAAPSSVGVLDSPSAMPSPARITVFGPASNPRITIGGNRYEVDAEVPAGGLLIIDGIERKITVRTEYGIEENAFGKRVGKQKAGCGTFVFEPVPPGSSIVSWDGSFCFGVRLFEQRDERRWA